MVVVSPVVGAFQLPPLQLKADAVSVPSTVRVPPFWVNAPAPINWEPVCSA